MKGLEVTLDGIKYFVTANSASATTSTLPTLILNLYLNSLRSLSVYNEIIEGETAESFDVRKAKKFIKRALAYDPKSK